MYFYFFWFLLTIIADFGAASFGLLGLLLLIFGVVLPGIIYMILGGVCAILSARAAHHMKIAQEHRVHYKALARHVRYWTQRLGNNCGLHDSQSDMILTCQALQSHYVILRSSRQGIDDVRQLGHIVMYGFFIDRYRPVVMDIFPVAIDESGQLIPERPPTASEQRQATKDAMVASPEEVHELLDQLCRAHPVDDDPE